MNQIIAICTIVLALIACQVLGQDEYYGKQEASCIQKGGLCIQQSQCNRIIGVENELCPEQAAQGFQCCFGLPKNEKRCRRHGGECFKKNFCNQAIVYSQASDCGDDQDCCILM